MTSTTDSRAGGRLPWEPRLDFDAAAPAFSKAMSHLDNSATKQADEAGLDRAVRELVRVRASQLNGCAYCVDMHTKDARAAGETDQRLYSLAVWEETPFFSDQERAALRLAEAITCCADGHVPDAAWSAAASQFSDEELAALVGVIVTVNAWNRIGVATRSWLPGSYEA
jgi:AhpD family alkylhydroperoxidase